MRRLLFFVMFLSLAGCFLAPPQSSCDGRPQGEPVCDDLTTNRNSQLEPTLKALCVGTFSTDLCDHTGSLGGCLCEACENGRAITWFFASADAGIATAADVMAECTKEGRPYQTP